MTLVYIFLSLILISTITSCIVLIRSSRRANRNRDLSGERYYELKSEIKYIASSGAIIIAVLGFMGYQKYEDIFVQFKDLETKSKKLETKLDSADTKILSYEKTITELTEQGKSIRGTVGLSTSELSSLRQKIENIRTNNILDKNFYFIENLNLPDNKFRYKKFYFSQLETSLGDRLPVFKIPPTILIAPSTAVNFYIKELTNEYVEIGLLSSFPTLVKKNVDGSNLYEFTLILSKQE